MKDVLEDDVTDKYFLSDAAINKCLKSQANENMLDKDIPDKSRCIVAGYYKQPFDGQYLKIKTDIPKEYEEAEEVVCSDVFELRTDEGIRYFGDNLCGTIRTTGAGGDKHTIQNYKIRRLTPRECFRLMDFPDTFTWDVSDSQAYKQAGNSIVVNVLYKILKNLNL